MNLHTMFRALGRAGPLARALIEGLDHRRELFLLELRTAGNRLRDTLLMVVFASGLVFFAGFTLTLAFAAAVWHREDRALLLLLLASAELLLASALVAIVTRKLRDWAPFEDTVGQLKTDRQCLDHLLKE